MDVADVFRLRERDARSVLGEVAGAVTRWREVASDAGLEGLETDRMARAFEHDETARARELAR
jgi:hypothetical protein